MEDGKLCQSSHRRTGSEDSKDRSILCIVSAVAVSIIVSRSTYSDQSTVYGNVMSIRKPSQWEVSRQLRLDTW
jgi:hypothetical protein